MAGEKSADPNCEIWLIRHAESEWNATGRWQGHADPPLSDRGREQLRGLVQALAEAPRAEPVDQLFCSDLTRTRETAAAVAGLLGLTPQPDSSLRELDVGEWSGLTRPEIAERDPQLLEAFDGGGADVRPPGGETRAEIRLRARQAIARIASAHSGERVVVVSHLGFIRALLPGQTPSNAEFIRVSAEDALTRREAQTRNSERVGSQPL